MKMTIILAITAILHSEILLYTYPDMNEESTS